MPEARASCTCVSFAYFLAARSLEPNSDISTLYIFSVSFCLLQKYWFTDIFRTMNWKTIIAELQAYGVTQPQIAVACGCAQATISDLATGKSTEPRHALGQSILAMHQEKTSTQESA